MPLLKGESDHWQRDAAVCVEFPDQRNAQGGDDRQVHSGNAICHNDIPYHCRLGSNWRTNPWINR